MKTNQKFNLFLSIRSIKSKALRASAIAATRTEAQRAKVSRKKSVSNLDREINLIFQTIKSMATDNERIFLERGGKDCCLKAKISIFSVSDLLRQDQEEEAHSNAVSSGADRSRLIKPFKAYPKVIYTFYASVYNPDKLGSVAIYGENADATNNRILLHGHLFGHPVRRTTVEMGRRPFVDVVLAA